MVYKWKQDRFDAEAQKVGEELERIEYKDAESVVKAARKSKGELHKCFEWDDSIAGEEYRKEQARLVLRMLVVKTNVERGDEVVTIYPRAYESVRYADDEGKPEKAMTYVPTRKALADPELRAQIIDRLDSTIAEAQKTAEDYSYLVPQFVQTGQKLKEARTTVRA